MKATLRSPSAARISKPSGNDLGRAQATAWLGLLLLASVLIRVHGLDRPLLGHFAQYQALQGMMARNIERDASSWAAPRTFIVQGDSTARHLLYFPFAALAAAAGHSVSGGTLDLWGRSQAVVFFCLASVFLYRLLRLGSGRRTALAGVLVFSLAPSTIIYGQQFQNEMATLSFMISYVFFLMRWGRPGGKGLRDALLAGVAGGLALLARLHLLYLALPTAYVLLRERKRLIARDVILFLAVALGPAVAWAMRAAAFEQDPLQVHSRGLMTQLALKTAWHAPLILKADFYRRLADHFSGVVLGPFALTFALLGVLAPWKGPYWKAQGAWLVASGLGLLILPAKAYDHDFYCMLALPPLCVFAARSLAALRGPSGVPLIRCSPACALFLGLWFAVSLRFAWNPAFKSPPGDEVILQASEETARRTRPAERVVVNGPAQIALYYMDRNGFLFPSTPGEEYLPSATRQAAWAPKLTAAFEALRTAFRDPTAWLDYARAHGARYFLNLDPEFFGKMPQAAAYLAREATLLASQGGGYWLYSFKPR